MFWLKLVLKSVLCGTVATVLLVAIALYAGNEIVTYILLPPVWLLYASFGNNEPLGSDAVIIQALPNDFFVLFLGMLLSIPFYSVISFFVFLLMKYKKKRQQI